MSQSDSNPLDPSALLEPLPGHSSLGRLERILRRRAAGPGDVDDDVEDAP